MFGQAPEVLQRTSRIPRVAGYHSKSCAFLLLENAAAAVKRSDRVCKPSAPQPPAQQATDAHTKLVVETKDCTLPQSALASHHARRSSSPEPRLILSPLLAFASSSKACARCAEQQNQDTLESPDRHGLSEPLHTANRVVPRNRLLLLLRELKKVGYVLYRQLVHGVRAV